MARTISDDQILEAALNVIVQRGYAGATTREISTAAGMNEVTLFRRFGSKEQLLRAVVEQEAQRFSLLGIEYTGDLEGDLLRVVCFYRDLMRVRGRIIAMLINEIPRQPELMGLMETPLQIFISITAMIKRYQDDGALVEEPPEQTLLALVGPLFLDGLLGFVQPQLGGAGFTPEELVARFLHGRA
ncbi:MAG: TetR/AcrR family transcriptional regulator [Anaerolineales bacterium]|nr:TetR/AcrR family transcriptional regulator [Anaerolineales bacterium]